MTSASSALARHARRALCALSLAAASLPLVPGAAAARSTRDFSYVLLASGEHSSMVNGTGDDFRRAESLRSGDAGLIYVRQNGAAYVIRDAGLVRRADAIAAPQRLLGKRQGELGRQQGELGRRQSVLGAEQARLGRDQTKGWADQMGELGRQQGKLCAQQAALGSRQAELGRQQAAAARQAEGQMEALVADAIRRGLAERVQ